MIDYLSRRQVFFENAALIIQLGATRKVDLFISSLSFASASYILHAHYKIEFEDIIKSFDEVVNLCNITVVDTQTVKYSISSGFKDFEDAMQYYSALRVDSDYIITRNKGDFALSKIPVYEPDEFIDMLVEYSKNH